MARKRYKPEEIVAKLRQIGRLWLADGSCIEFSHECLAIRVARKLKAIDVIDVLSDLLILRGHSRSHPVR